MQSFFVAKKFPIALIIVLASIAERIDKIADKTIIIADSKANIADKSVNNAAV